MAITLTGMIAGGQIAPAASTRDLVMSIIFGNMKFFCEKAFVQAIGIAYLDG